MPALAATGAATTVNSNSPAALPPVLHMRQFPGRLMRIRNSDRITLRSEKLAKPAPHLAAAAHHQRPVPLALAAGLKPDPLLARQRRVDQQAHDVLGQIARQPGGFRLFAGPAHHAHLLGEIARGNAGLVLDLADVRGNLLAPRKQADDLAVDGAQLFS